MATSIYEYNGPTRFGGHGMAHIVSIGAHDGHGKMGTYVRKIQPNSAQQYTSWFHPDLRIFSIDGSPVVGQIFFPTADTSLDSMNDKKVLDVLVAYYRYVTGDGTGIVLEFVGRADPRGTADYNMRIGQKRADQVWDYVSKGINRSARLLPFHSTAVSAGETYTTGDYNADRRVDIVLKTVGIPRVVFAPAPVTGDYKGPLARKLLFKGYLGVSIGFFKYASLDVMEMEIKNPNTGQQAFYQYIGVSGAFGTPGLPASIGSPDTAYTEIELPPEFGMVDVGDFEGSGSIQNAAGGVLAQKTGTLINFNGPKLHFTKKFFTNHGVSVFMDGIQLGGTFSAGMGVGYWKKARYTTTAQRNQHYAEVEMDRRRVDHVGPKY